MRTLPVAMHGPAPVTVSTGGSSASTKKKRKTITESQNEHNEKIQPILSSMAPHTINLHHQPPQASSGSAALFAGMVRSGDDAFEVWMHGDCTVWASGVHMIGARIVGLETAVWQAACHRCDMCSERGALFACLSHGCGRQAHVPCARSSDWSLSEDDFKPYCSEHSPNNAQKSIHSKGLNNGWTASRM